MRYTKTILYFFIILFVVTKTNAQTPASYFPWTKHPEKIKELDSLLSKSALFALDPLDYNKVNIKWEKDSAKADSIIHKTAIHFFGELAFGNHAPNLQYEGVNFKIDKTGTDKLVKLYASTKTLAALAQYYNHQSKEVVAILKLLQNTLDSFPANKLKIAALKKATNDYRWLNAVKKNQKLILVNIPSAQLHVFDGDSNPINMKVIVGKSKTPTSTLSSTIGQVIVNPYWTVPKSIATKEMLPVLKKDRSYIERTHLQVLNENYKVVNPSHINWDNYDVNYFPFTIRQSTGCDNSLGVLKLDFDSPFGIYLHDTPEKSLFETSNRFYSHGCMRMEKPIEIGKWVLQNNRAALDTIDLSKCYKNPSPINLPVTQKIQVIVWYNLVDFDQLGQLHYYKDIYHIYSY